MSRALNGLLRSDDNAMEILRRLDGRIIALCVRDTDLIAFAAPIAEGIRLLRSYEGEVDVRVTGSTADFIAYARASKRGDSIGAGRIEISGDLSTAQSVQMLLSELRIDWEEILSRYIGDVGAHQAGRLVRAATAWGTTAAARFEEDVAEYLQIEARVLPTRRDTERLARAIFILADDVDRLEARIRRVEAST
jgi:ubiquinone biosynthesis accessory factor UbiJ